jgi:hypothetical protein
MMRYALFTLLMLVVPAAVTPAGAGSSSAGK